MDDKKCTSMKLVVDLVHPVEHTAIREKQANYANKRIKIWESEIGDLDIEDEIVEKTRWVQKCNGDPRVNI